jgi:hypothetical protein
MIPVNVFELTEGGYVASISYQKGKKGKNELTSFSKYAEDQTALGTLVAECIERWTNRENEE